MNKILLTISLIIILYTNAHSEQLPGEIQAVAEDMIKSVATNVQPKTERVLVIKDSTWIVRAFGSPSTATRDTATITRVHGKATNPSKNGTCPRETATLKGYTKLCFPTKVVRKEGTAKDGMYCGPITIYRSYAIGTLPAWHGESLSCKKETR